MRVLICDDEADVRALYRVAFEDAGALVDEADDGDAAVTAAALEQPDIVVLDLFMPRRDGLSALPEVLSRSPGSRVVIVSAHAAVEVFETARSLGAVACFDKVGFLRRIPLVMERYGTPVP